MTVVIRKAYGFDARALSDASSVNTGSESKTVQSGKADADINVIMKRFGVTKVMPIVGRIPRYEDFEDVFDFRTAMDTVNAANRAFMQLPAAFRKRLGNDPQEFLKFVQNEENRAELEKLGLVVKKPEVVDPPPMKVEVVNPVPKEPVK